MKILMTGGGSGGHFYPIIAIAQEVNAIARENKVADIELYYMSPTPYNEGLLFDNKIVYKKNSAGKMRRYFSLRNLIDFFKTGWGIIKSVWEIFLIYPDVVFGKGGYASFPALFAARILRIPVVIHESDAAPGRTNRWAGKFAERIALSFPEAAEYFKRPDSIALTGHPIRRDLFLPLTSNAHEYLHLDSALPTILFLGGSLGAKIINDAVLEALPRLVEKYQIIHQTGKSNFAEVKATSEVVLRGSASKDRYRPYEYFDELMLRSAAGAANLVVSRAGSTIFEIAAWKIPAILIPIRGGNEDHQRKNAFAYARSGAAVVIEEDNLTGNILFAEIDRIIADPSIREAMSLASQSFIKPGAAKAIAEELLKIALRHEI